MKVNCLGCGFKLDLDDAYDDYEGPIKCFACGATLEIRAEQGYLGTVRQASLVSHATAAERPVFVGKPLKQPA
ncbi:MAG: hypothetical protein ABSE79_15475 [Terriglobia bacterium]